MEKKIIEDKQFQFNKLRCKYPDRIPVIIEENPMVNDEVIQDNYNSENDYTWDDNKQHTEQCFF